MIDSKDAQISALKTELAEAKAENAPQKLGTDGKTFDFPYRYGIVCFHCGIRFRTPGSAEQHFGKTPSSMPACQIAFDDLLTLRETESSLTAAQARIEALEEAQFQARVASWMQACFGPEISRDTLERNHRFFEEATELVQANGMTRKEAHQLVDYTYGRPIGDREQEVGGVMITLAALCLASDMDMHILGERELTRIWDKIDQIRAKQATKPHYSPLPERAALARADEAKK